MKKIFLSVLTIFLAASLYATDLNIYASGLNATQSAGVTTVQYTLNAQATAVNVKLYNGGVSPVKVIAVSDESKLTKGTHSVVLDLSDVANGTYTWAVEAFAPANNTLVEINEYADTEHSLYGYRGIAIDNSPESDYFGRLYLSNAQSGTTSGFKRTTNQGIYIFDALLAPVNNLPYTGGITWTTGTGLNALAPYRLAIDEEGYVFIVDNGTEDSKKAVYMMDPADPSANFVEVLNKSLVGSLYHRINSIAVTGKGTNRVLYAIDNTTYTDSIVSYPIGDNNSLPCSTKGATLVPRTQLYSAAGIANALNSLARDKNGGFWVSQYRSGLDHYSQLAHFNASGLCDFKVNDTINSSYGLSSTLRGAMGLNPSCTLVAFGGKCTTSNTKGTVQVFTISENGDIALAGFSMPTDMGGSSGTIDGIAFDVADNMYVVSAAAERLRVFATPKADNRYETPARSTNPIVVGGVLVTGVSLDPTEATLELQRTVTLVSTISPNNATNQNVSWESSNTSVATVSNTGVVTAVAEGSATITVTTEDGGFTATCDITVDPYEISVNTLYLDQTIAELSGKTIRRALVRGEHMFVLALDNSNNPYLYRVNTHNGEVVDIPTTVCEAPVDANGLKLSDIALTSDGILVGCNKEKCATPAVSTNQFKIYKWTESAGVFTGVVWSSRASNCEAGNFSNAYAGETMAYIGSSTMGKVVASAVTTGGSGAIRFGITNFSSGSFSSATYNRTGDASPLTEGYMGTKFKLNVAPNGTSLVIDGNQGKPYVFDLINSESSIISKSLLISSVDNAAYTNYFSYDDKDLAVSTHFTASQNDGFELNEIVGEVTPAVEHDAPALSPIAATYAVALGATESGEAYFYVLRDDKLSAYTTANAYTRSGLAVDNFSTICLPYAVDAGKIWGAEVYNVASANGSPLTSITLSQEDGGLVAGKPYVIKPTKNTFACIYTGDEQTLVQEANGLVGKLDESAENVPDGVSSYIFKDGQLHFVPEGVTISFMQNRAYFDKSAYSGPASAPGRKTLTIPAAPNNATGMDNVEQNEEVQKFFRDGKVYIRRGNTVYDALGRIINK